MIKIKAYDRGQYNEPDPQSCCICKRVLGRLFCVLPLTNTYVICYTCAALLEETDFSVDHEPPLCFRVTFPHR